MSKVNLKWVDGSKPTTLPAGSSFGLPWKKGQIDKTTAVAASFDGQPVALQTWPLAYWPDGSLKWTGHALSADGNTGETLTVSLGTPAEPQSPVSVNEEDSTIEVSTGSFKATFNKSGSTLIDSLSLNGAVKASGGTILIHVQNGPDNPDVPGDRPSVIATTGSIEQVTVEQTGPVRAVIKVTGKYSGDGHAEFLPFIVRFYIAAGATGLRFNHFFSYDGDQQKDFIRGIGLRLSVPLSDVLQDRHVRFISTEGGVWGEAVRVVSGLRRDATAAVLTPQFEGQATPDVSTWPTTIGPYLDTLPVWSDFTLDQQTPEYFRISKRTNAGSKAAFLTNAGHGAKASGVGYLGGAKAGGLVFALRDFWEGGPRGLDIRNAGSDTGEVTLWAYSPRAEALDMRHYDTVAHGLDLAYEDVGNPDPDPTGIGRSYEAVLEIVGSTPSREDLAKFSASHVQQPQLVAGADFYASANIFGGSWSVAGNSSYEDKINDWLDFYVLEVKQRQIYGFWGFGDTYHTYDSTRHTWRYDVGGYAWDNGELGTDLWLWMSFLRTGRADIWKLAKNMTRVLSESCQHHVGTYQGLGCRHNVSIWGDGAKEARVAGSSLRRPLFYLSGGDELLGDIMDTSLQVDWTILTWEPFRKVLPPPPAGVGRLRIGPDWTALAGNWFTKWERTLDEKYLNKLLTGMRDIAQLPNGIFCGYGSAVGWDADGGHLTDLGSSFTSSYHLTMLFGGGELLMEIVDTIDEPGFKAVWLDFCKYYNASAADKTAKYGQNFNSGGFQQLYAKLQVYAGTELGDDSLKQAAWNNYVTYEVKMQDVTDVGGTDVISPIKEINNCATNDVAQNSLSRISLLHHAPELAPSGLTKRQNTPLTAVKEEWDTSTIAAQASYAEKASVRSKTAHSRKNWRRFFCF